MRKLRRLFRTKKAFSPVIAALILMLLAVAAGVVVYSYVMGWIGGSTRTSGGTQGEMILDSIYGDATNDLIRIYVRNTGGKDLVLNKVYVDGIQTANNTAITSSSGALSVNAVKYLEVNKTMTAGYFYDVTISCEDGTTISQSVEAE